MNIYWRGEFFNKIIKELNYSSYLELGVSTGECCWNIVECDRKVGVDSNPTLDIPNVICTTTDEYFASLDNNVKFDLIFIDAYHEKYQVYKDFCNSLNHLTPNGIIVFHDIYPLSKQNINIQTANGNVYELWIELVNKYNSQVSVVIGYPGNDEGTIGIYFNSSSKFNRNSIDVIEHSYEYFFDNLKKYIYDKELKYDQVISRLLTN